MPCRDGWDPKKEEQNLKMRANLPWEIVLKGTDYIMAAFLREKDAIWVLNDDGFDPDTDEAAPFNPTDYEVRKCPC